MGKEKIDRGDPILMCKKCGKLTKSTILNFYISPENEFIADMDHGIGRDSVGNGNGYPCNHCNWWNLAHYKRTNIIPRNS
jgi:hypothetical protein